MENLPGLDVPRSLPTPYPPELQKTTPQILVVCIVPENLITWPTQVSHSFRPPQKGAQVQGPFPLLFLVKAKRVEFRMYGACSIACIFYAGFWTDVQGPWLLLTEFRYIPCTILSPEYEDGMAIVSYCDMDFKEAV